jgi:hypothetical protein
MNLKALHVLGGLYAALSASALSAWHGEITPGSGWLTRFTPYFVPEGSKSYDSASPLLHYSGPWIDTYSNSYIENTLRQARQSNASCSLTFHGTGIEWFGNMGRNHGTHDVYIDGESTYWFYSIVITDDYRNARSDS